MLSPAVRAAAAQFAGSNREFEPKAVELGYLTGYAAGYVAPKSARFPLAGDTAFKRLLGAYLAENITIYHPRTGRYGLLKGLPACYAKDGEPFADVEFYADAEARAEGGGDLTEPESRIVPVLYPLSALANPELAENVGRLFREDFLSISEIRSQDPEEAVAIYIDVPQGTALVHYRKKDLESGSQQLLQRDAERLRSLHFAVGLAPHQYHRRVVGFDYASGGRPATACAQNCAGCQKGREVCGG